MQISEWQLQNSRQLQNNFVHGAMLVIINRVTIVLIKNSPAAPVQ